jgi:hypothetical protein
MASSIDVLKTHLKANNELIAQQAILLQQANNPVIQRIRSNGKG